MVLIDFDISEITSPVVGNLEVQVDLQHQHPFWAARLWKTASAVHAVLVIAKLKD